MIAIRYKDTGAVLHRMRKAADLTNANLFAADLEQAHLQGATLSHARLQTAILRNADCLVGCTTQSFVQRVLALFVPEGRNESSPAL